MNLQTNKQICLSGRNINNCSIEPSIKLTPQLKKLKGTLLKECYSPIQAGKHVLCHRSSKIHSIGLKDFIVVPR